MSGSNYNFSGLGRLISADVLFMEDANAQPAKLTVPNKDMNGLSVVVTRFAVLGDPNANLNYTWNTTGADDLDTYNLATPVYSNSDQIVVLDAVNAPNFRSHALQNTVLTVLYFA